MTRRQPAQVVEMDDFMTRAIHRMHEIGIIDTAARDRILASPMPKDPYQQIGALRALLGIAIWRVEPRIEWKKGDRVRVKGDERLGIGTVGRVTKFLAYVKWPVTKKNAWAGWVRRIDMERAP